MCLQACHLSSRRGNLLRLRMDCRRGQRRFRSLLVEGPHHGAGTRDRIDHMSFAFRGRRGFRKLVIPLNLEVSLILPHDAGVDALPLNFSAALGLSLFLSGWNFSAAFRYAFLISSWVADDAMPAGTVSECCRGARRCPPWCPGGGAARACSIKLT